MSKSNPHLSLQNMRDAFEKMEMNGIPRPIVLLDPKTFSRVENAVKEGAVLPHFFGTATEVHWWLHQWDEKKKANKNV